VIGVLGVYRLVTRTDFLDVAAVALLVGMIAFDIWSFCRVIQKNSELESDEDAEEIL
jgi:hypothetical protein